MKLIFAFILAYLASGSLLRADSIPLIFNGMQLHYGFVIPHSEKIKDVAFTNPVGIEFIHGKLHTSFSDWQVFNNFWVSGLKGRYFNFRYPQVLGSVFDITAFAGPLVSQGRKHQLTISGGAGISYHTAIYDQIENPLNQFFSTRISFPLYVEAKFKYRFNDRSFITLSGCYNHISNGGIKQPNFGMNFPTAALGFEHFNIRIPDPENNFRFIAPSRSGNVSIVLQALSSYKVMDATPDFPEKGFLVYGFHARASKPLGSIYSINAGGEFIIDGYIRESVKREGKNTDNKRFAFTLGQDFTFGRILFTQYIGIYTYAPYKARNMVYQKYELAYKTPGRIMYGVFLKSHLYVAELLGLTIGYQLIR